MAVVAQFLANVCGIPLQADPGIREKITCDLRDLPWDQVIARLLDMLDLDITAAGNGLLHPASRSRPSGPAQGYIWSKADKRREGAVAALVRGEKNPYYLTALFGKRVNPFTKKEDFHPGLDIAAKKGAPVFSAAAGTVTASEFNEQAGNFITIDHGNGYSSGYHHLDSREVKKGDNGGAGAADRQGRRNRRQHGTAPAFRDPPQRRAAQSL